MQKFIAVCLLSVLLRNAAAFSGDPCSKNADCGQNEVCSFYDEQFAPWMWPPCPHYGKCACVDGTVNVNSRCLAYVNLNLYDKCTNAGNERFSTPDQICDGRQVVCNKPTYIDAGGYCQLAPPPPTRAVPTMGVRVGPNIITAPVAPVLRTVAAAVVQTVYYRDTCDNRGLTRCDATKGLCCQNMGGSGTAPYLQCLCCDKHNVYDEQLQNCRPRIYGDVCVEDEECNSGLIGSQGYECRLGRCRCQAGYDPVDNLYWNDGSRTTLSRRICVINTAVTWVPTGQQCTINPEQWSQYQSTRVCHSRAFCHQCFKERAAANSTIGSTGPVMGTCRELVCQTDSDCQSGMVCNHWNYMVDPPCDNGMCDCPGASTGTYIDRFSRCSSYKPMGLGDRCMTSGLHPWYQNNEVMVDATQTCIEDGLGQNGYAGYSHGVVKCTLPFIEDMNGNCVHNDDLSGTLFIYRSYGDNCDDTDLRLPRSICDSRLGLVCRNRKCDCPAQSRMFWDGQRCRNRDYGDPCTTTGDCQTGTYYPTPSAVVCSQGLCVCGSGYTALDLGASPMSPAPAVGRRYCFRSYTLVTKGSECHLDPANYAKQQGPYKSDPALICSPGAYCMRCPADIKPDDEGRGICRTVTPLGKATPGPGGVPVYQPPPQPVLNCSMAVQNAIQDWRNAAFTNAPATMAPMLFGGQPNSLMSAPTGDPFGSSTIRVDWRGVSFDVRTFVYIVNNGSRSSSKFP